MKSIEEEIESILMENRSLDFVEGFIYGLYFMDKISVINVNDLNKFAMLKDKQFKNKKAGE